MGRQLTRGAGQQIIMKYKKFVVCVQVCWVLSLPMNGLERQQKFVDDELHRINANLAGRLTLLANEPILTSEL